MVGRHKDNKPRKNVTDKAAPRPAARRLPLPPPPGATLPPPAPDGSVRFASGSWLADPYRRHEYRWHNGASFTDQVSDDGVVSTNVTGWRGED